ncbi:MAG: branched-chain amino acid transaminase [Nitrososphaeraceae archaeon]
MNSRKIWIDGNLIDWDDAKIHILTHALHYATAVFEGIRCYDTNKGPAIFRMRDHIRRLQNSGKMYHMNIEYSEEELELAIIETLKANDVSECYIRPIAYYGYGKMGVNPLPNKVSIGIALWDWDEYLSSTPGEEGVRAIVSSWVKMDNRCLPVLAKATANYANSALARIEAIKSGVEEAIMLNHCGMVAEGTAENVFIVSDSTLITPPVTAGALDGITRATILEIANKMGIRFKICDIYREEMYIADEVFLAGTAAEIKAVTEIDRIRISDGRVGSLTRKLQTYYRDIVHGRDKAFDRWLTYVK